MRRSSIIHDGAVEKVWKDYCIAQHLALHHVYAVPRGGPDDTMEHFETEDPRFRHHVVIGQRLAFSALNATKIRRHSVDPLEAYCFPQAAAYIRRNGFWGYSGTPCQASTVPAEFYEPLRKFIRRPAVFENRLQGDEQDGFLWVDRTRQKLADPYLIVFRGNEQPHFKKFYVS